MSDLDTATTIKQVEEGIEHLIAQGKPLQYVPPAQPTALDEPSLLASEAELESIGINKRDAQAGIVPGVCYLARPFDATSPSFLYKVSPRVFAFIQRANEIYAEYLFISF